MTGRRGRTTMQRLMDWTDRSQGADACWPWTGSTNASGYGQIKADGRMWLAHRLIFALTVGDPGDREVAHTCDNPPCCNRAHLFRATHAENMADMVAKGRSPRSHRSGEDHPRARLTWDVVRAIRGSMAPVAVLADRHSVTTQHIHLILAGQRWREETTA